MATLALHRPTLPISARALELAPLALGLMGLGLGWAGADWDAAWHRLIGRDTFWSAPHVLMYTGTALTGLAALVATFTAMRGRHVRSRELAIGPFHAERGLALVGIGALVIISAAPFDDLWHRAFGRDIDIWSPPHLFAVAGAVLAYAGLSAAAGVNAFSLPPRPRAALTLLLIASLIGTFVFGMNFYYIMGWSREALLYPLVVSATIPFALAMSVTLLPGSRFAASAAALVFTILALLTYVALRALDWPPPAFPPLVLAGALALDAGRRRTANAVLLGAAFALTFVIGEGLRLLAFVPPPPSPAAISDPQFGGLVLTYWLRAEARPWLSAWPLLAALLGVPLAAASWWIGRGVARNLAAR